MLCFDMCNKIICVNDIEDGLTLNKKYEVVSAFYLLKVRYITICNNFGLYADYKAEYFKTIEELREDKLKEIGI